MIPVIPVSETDIWLANLVKPSVASDNRVSESVKAIIQQVAEQGDAAIKALAEKFGETPPESIRVPESVVTEAVKRLPAETRVVLDHAAENIRAYNQAIVDSLKPIAIERDGFSVGMDYKPVERVACYVPGGRYPLPSTALMTALTAKTAGVHDIVICCPRPCDEVFYAGTLAGVTEFYQMGGAQAVAAVAYGTQTIPSVDMVVGPGNAYVTEAKRQLQGVIGIDMLAGPSELVIIADADAPADWVALDLLAQAEHDPDSRVYLLTPSTELVSQVAEAIPKWVDKLQLPEFVGQSLAGSALVVLKDMNACIAASDKIAPEHLELMVSNPDTIKPCLHHYGALFLGYEATVPHGDYLSGPNHTLPTHRTARFSGLLSPLTFLRPQSWMRPHQPLQRLNSDTNTFATLEGLKAHAAAAQARLR